MWRGIGQSLTLDTPTMPLTAVEARNAKPRDRDYKLFDERGLYLFVRTNGTKAWRMKYRIQGREKTLAFGLYPEVSLAEARDERDDARTELRKGIDPSAARQAQRRAQSGKDSFEAVAREWHLRQVPRWAPRHASEVMRRLERDILPFVGRRRTDELEPPDLLPVARRCEARGAIETAHRVLGICGQVMRYAIATGRATRDPTRDLRGALTAAQKRHHPAITDPAELGALLRAINGYEGSPVTRAALELAPLLFVRPGEMRHMEWAEITSGNNSSSVQAKLDGDTWILPEGKMKGRRSHIVPLARQSVAVLKEIEPLTGAGRYVFPSERSRTRPISNNTINAALRRLGYSKDQVTAHGFRATARTLLDEKLNERVELIEHQLAHAVQDPLGRAYNRTQFLPERRAMMQRWADYLDQLRDG